MEKKIKRNAVQLNQLAFERCMKAEIDDEIKWIEGVNRHILTENERQALYLAGVTCAVRALRAMGVLVDDEAASRRWLYAMADAADAEHKAWCKRTGNPC